MCDRSTPVSFLTTGISKPTILCPINLSAVVKNSTPLLIWSGLNLNISPELGS